VGRRRYPEREEGDGSGGAPGCSPQSSRVHAAQVPQLASRRRFCDADASELKTSKVPLIGGGECRRRVDGRTNRFARWRCFPEADFVFDWRRYWLLPVRLRDLQSTELDGDAPARPVVTTPK
jgi:hypothetical protein